MIRLPVEDRKEDKIAMPQQHTQKGEHISQCHNTIFGKAINSQPTFLTHHRQECHLQIHSSYKGYKTTAIP
jgi:hypothetical protein